MHQLAQHTGLVTVLDRDVELFKRHLPYHESDHVLGIAYNVLCGGTCVQDIELRRQNEVYLDALGAQRIPDPTTAGDFCRRFAEAIIDADGTLAETTGQCKEGMDIAYTGVWRYHPLAVSLANTRSEPFFLVSRSGNRPSAEVVFLANDRTPARSLSMAC